MSDDEWEQASVSKSFIARDGCAGNDAHQPSTGARRCQSRPVPSVSHLTRRLCNSDGRLWRWGGTEGEIRAYPNKLISTISARFLLMDPRSCPKVWLRSVATRATRSCFTNQTCSWSRWCCKLQCCTTYLDRLSFCRSSVIQPISVHHHVSLSRLLQGHSPLVC